MKKILILIIGILFTDFSYSQIDFHNAPESYADKYTDYYKLNKSADKELRLNNDSVFDFEFRLWTNHNWGYRSLFILRKVNDKDWKAYCINYDGQKDKWKKQKVSQTDLDVLWKDILRHKVLTLPTQDSIRYKMRAYAPDTSMVFFAEDTYKVVQVLDGTGYRFELKTKDKQRVYNYHCPKSYLKHFPCVEELYRAFAIIVLVRKQLGLDYDIC